MNIKLEDLLPAPAQGEQPAPEVRSKARDLRHLKGKAKARLVAQEYVRNGMRLIDAYNTVCGTKHLPQGAKITVHRLLGKGMDEFVDELGRLLEKSDISREKALALLWAMVNTSILDFMDDAGNVLPVAELKKLPRVMQVLISEVEVRSQQVLAIDPDTQKPMLDDVGRPYLLTKSYVKIKIPEKLTAFRQLAEVMRWVGPAVQINNFNIGNMMAERDEAASRMNEVYDGQYIEVRKD